VQGMLKRLAHYLAHLSPSKCREHGAGDAESGPEGEVVTALQDGTIE